MKEWIRAAGAGGRSSRDLLHDEAAAVAHMIARGEATDAQIGAWLMAERMKGETDDEIMAVVQVFRMYGTPIQSYSASIHCAGAHDVRKYFPVTIPVSLLLASVHVPQVLYGGDAQTSSGGFSIMEMLEELGVTIQTGVPEWEKTFAANHINFLRMDRICPPLRAVRHIREQIGLRTLLDTVEKLINPVQSSNLIIGVEHAAVMRHLMQILPRAGYDTALIVQGIEGSEDLAIYKNSPISKVTAFGDEASVIDPATFGFEGAPFEPLDKARQADLLRRVIEGDDSDELTNEREHVVFNAGLRLYWFDKVPSYEDGFMLARSLLQRKEAAKTLARWVALGKRS